MRVCTYADAFSAVGGIERVQLEVSRCLAERGHDLTVLVKDPAELRAEWERFARVEVVPGFTLWSDNPVGALGRVLTTTRRSVASDPDVFYLHRHAVLQSAWPAAVLSGGAGIVCHLHAPAPLHRGLATRFLHRRVDRFVAVSDAVARSWTAVGIPPRRLVTVHNGVDTDHFVPADPDQRRRVRAEIGLGPDEFVVVFTGRVVPEKGVTVLADAVARVAAADPEVRLVIVGADPDHSAPGDDRELLRALARRVPPTTRWFPRQVDVRPFLWAADVACVPSICPDAQPLGVIEPLACGIPVVASAVGGIPEQLSGPLAPGLVPAGDVDALAERIRALRWWRRDHPGIGTTARGAAEVRFATGRVVDRIETELLNAARRRRRRAR